VKVEEWRWRWRVRFIAELSKQLLVQTLDTTVETLDLLGTPSKKRKAAPGPAFPVGSPPGKVTSEAVGREEEGRQAKKSRGFFLRFLLNFSGACKFSNFFVHFINFARKPRPSIPYPGNIQNTELNLLARLLTRVPLPTKMSYPKPNFGVSSSFSLLLPPSPSFSLLLPPSPSPSFSLLQTLLFFFQAFADLSR
jgi:hypothetical protein